MASKDTEMLKKTSSRSFGFIENKGQIIDQNNNPNLANGNIPTRATLSIDPLPDRVWGTYFGGTGMEWIGGCVVHKNGDIILYGMTNSPANIATAGAHQTVNMGNMDAFLAKFDKDGVIQWSTYYGGVGIEQNISATIDQFQNVYLTGSTTSETNIATPDGFQPVKSTGSDAFLARFRPDGVLEWGTYYGGEGNDAGFECSVDLAGNIYMTGESTSSGSIATPGSYQETLNGFRDAFLVKIDGTCHRLWASYFGGEDSDNGFCCSSDSMGHVFIAGKTFSTTGIASPGAHQAVYGGDSDGFLACFSQQGQRIWSTYFGGEANDDVLDCVAILSGDIFIAGSTKSVINIATPNGFMTSYRGIQDGFAAKFAATGVIGWGTYYGGTNSDWLHSCALDDSLNLYLAGPVTSAGLSTSGVYQPNLANSSQDCILTKFDSAGTQMWATYYGGMGADHGWCAVDTSWRVYLSGYTASPTMMSSPDGYQPLFGGGDTDTFLTRFTQCMIPAATGPISGPDTVCKPASVISFTIPAISGASGYSWLLPPGATITGGINTCNIQVSFDTNAVSGNLTVYGTNYCGSGNEISHYVTVMEAPVPELDGPDAVCTGTPVLYTTAKGMFQYEWNISGGGIIVTGGGMADSTAMVQWENPGLHWIEAGFTDSSGCVAFIPAHKAVFVSGRAIVGVDITVLKDTVCYGQSVTCNAVHANGGASPQFQWKVNGVNAGINTPAFSYVPVNGDVVQCMLTSSDTVCTTNNPATSNAITMVVDPLQPVSVSISSSVNPFCPSNAVAFTATSNNGGSNPVFQWKVNGINAGTNSPTFIYNPENGDSIRCIMTSDLSCVTGNPASSAKIIMLGTLAPTVTFAPCFDTVTTLNAKPFRLKGGLPLGGTWSGPGVNSVNGVFNPALAGVGTHTLTYSYTNAYGCEASTSVTIVTRHESPFTCGNTLTDTRDNKSYPTVQIGTQCWISSNLEYGLTIDELTPQTDNCVSEYYITPGDFSSSHFTFHSYRFAFRNSNLKSEKVKKCETLNVNCDVRNGGALYQWDELMHYDPTPGAQGLCPPGWHVPTETEWATLLNFYQGASRAGRPLQDPEINGFWAIPGGIFYSQGFFRFDDFATFFWSSTPSGNERALAYGMNTWNFSVSLYPAGRGNAFAVRCLRD